MKENKWMKHLTKQRIAEILALNPDHIDFLIEPPKIVTCTVRLKNGQKVWGLSICSTLDKARFSLKTGKMKASGRALSALKKKGYIEPIRVGKDCPRTWSKVRVKMIQTMHDLFGCKGKYTAVSYPSISPKLTKEII